MTRARRRSRRHTAGAGTLASSAPDSSSKLTGGAPVPDESARIRPSRRPSRHERPQEARIPIRAHPGPQTSLESLSARRQQVLTVLRASPTAMTARQVGERIGSGRHEAKRLLNLLLEDGHVGWTAKGWIPLAR